MFDILRHAIQFAGGFAGYPTKTLIDVYDQIINQQSNDLVELDKT